MLCLLQDPLGTDWCKFWSQTPALFNFIAVPLNHGRHEFILLSFFSILLFLASLESKHFPKDLRHFPAFWEMSLTTAYIKASEDQAPEDGHSIETKPKV